MDNAVGACTLFLASVLTGVSKGNAGLLVMPYFIGGGLGGGSVRGMGGKIAVVAPHVLGGGLTEFYGGGGGMGGLVAVVALSMVVGECGEGGGSIGAGIGAGVLGLAMSLGWQVSY